MLLCYSAIPSRSLRSAYQLMISGGDAKAVQGTTPVQAAPVEAEPTISVSALLELLKDADPSVKAQLRLALLTWIAKNSTNCRVIHRLTPSDTKNADRAKTVQRPCKWRTKRKSHEESYDSSWDFGALEGTRIPGPLIKRIQGASFVKFQKLEETFISSHYRKIHICTHRIICIQCNALQPLSSYSGVQKVCKNVQTGKTKPNGQINHRFYGRV